MLIEEEARRVKETGKTKRAIRIGKRICLLCVCAVIGLLAVPAGAEEPKEAAGAASAWTQETEPAEDAASSGETGETEAAARPSKEEDSASETGETEEAPKPAKGYVLVTTPTRQGFLPLPEEEDYVFPLTQTLADGTVWENVIHVTPEGFYMESANCEGHDCVDEGTVTLENRKDRILGNMVICLPHQITLELYTPEEIVALFGGSPEQGT